MFDELLSCITSLNATFGMTALGLTHLNRYQRSAKADAIMREETRKFCVIISDVLIKLIHSYSFRYAVSKIKILII